MEIFRSLCKWLRFSDCNRTKNTHWLRPESTHLKNLQKVFDRLREVGLKLKPNKCYLLLKEIAPDESKIEKNKTFPILRNAKWLMKVKATNSKLTRWALQIQDLNLDIQFRFTNHSANSE